MLSNRLTLAALFAALAGPALAQGVQFELVNRSDLTLMEFWTGPAGEGRFGDDLLGVNVIAAGDTGTVTITNGAAECEQDMRFVFEDGSDDVKTVNVCDTARLTVSAR